MGFSWEHGRQCSDNKTSDDKKLADAFDTRLIAQSRPNIAAWQMFAQRLKTSQLMLKN